MFNPKKAMRGGEKRQREPSPDPAPEKRIHTENPPPPATAPPAAPPFSPPPLKRSPNINRTTTAANTPPPPPATAAPPNLSDKMKNNANKWANRGREAANMPPPPPATAAPPNLSDKMKNNANKWANRGREAAQASTNAYSFKKEELSEPTTSSRPASTNRPEPRRPEPRRQPSEYTSEETTDEPSENRALNKVGEYGKRTGDVLDGVVHNSFDAADAATQVVSSALNQTGVVGKSALEATGKVTSAALKETGDSGATLVGNIAKEAFELPKDLLNGFTSIRKKISGSLRKNVLIDHVRRREKIINSTITEILEMQNVDNWVKEIMRDGEKKGWIPKKCYLWGCKGRKSIGILIRAVLQSVLFQGKNLDSLNIVQIKLETHKQDLEDIKNSITQLETDATGDNAIMNKLNDLTTKMDGSFNEFTDIVSTMKFLAGPKMIKIRASVTKAEEAEKRKNMTELEKTLYDEAMTETLPDASPSIKAKAEEMADKIEKKGEKELKEGVQEIQAIKKQQGGKSKKRTRKYRKSKRRKSQKSKVFVGSNKKSRKRLGRKTKKL